MIEQIHKYILVPLAIFAVMFTGILETNSICLAQQNTAAGKSIAASPNREASALDKANEFVVPRKNGTIVLEPYAPNIIRVSLSVNRAAALAPPGYGLIAKPSRQGWSHRQDRDGYDVFRSSRLIVRVSPENTPAPNLVPRDAVWKQLVNQIRGPRRPNNHIHNNVISVTTPEGKSLLTMWRWSMFHNKPLSGENITPEHKNLDPGYRVSARFASPLGENYYGLGQHQLGGLDLRDRRINCWHNYGALGGESVCVPFMVSNRGYGLLWDNPSKTTIDLGVNQENVWSSEVGNRISYFIIAGPKIDTIYEGYRHLTGVTQMLPKGAYGYIQSKCIYSTQKQLMDVAKGYRDRGLPLDVLVVDFYHQTKMGNLDLRPKLWPDPAKMNRQLHSMGIKTMISTWPHFAPGSKYYDMLRRNGWFVQEADGMPDPPSMKGEWGPNIDTTNPGAAQWFWNAVKDNYIEKYGFNYIWLDETEPDISPEHDFFYIGSGARYYNVYPLLHTAAVYNGFRRDFPNGGRFLILARAAYLGAQRNGTIFWSSDIMPTWDMLRRSITAGLNFTASGMPYWCTDIGGYARWPIYFGYHPSHKLLISPADDRSVVGNYSDYPELYVRWFEWGTFQPVMRAHGIRKENEVWSYGKQATPILEKYLRMRYALLPYTYSLAYQTYKTGAPYTQALWMDFPHDPKVANISDEYMFGPALLVAPVTDQGATGREVYLPAGTDWYNYWTNTKYQGGQTINVSAPISTIPLFVRAGSIIPIGKQVEDADQHQAMKEIRVYPGANATFTLYEDNGKTYDYKKDGRITVLHWNNKDRRFTHTGAEAWSVPDSELVKVIHASN